MRSPGWLGLGAGRLLGAALKEAGDGQGGPTGVHLGSGAQCGAEKPETALLQDRRRDTDRSF